MTSQLTYLLARERVADLRRAADQNRADTPRGHEHLRQHPSCVVSVITRRKRVDWPITARGVAWLEDYYRTGGQR